MPGVGDPEIWHSGAYEQGSLAPTPVVRAFLAASFPEMAEQLIQPPDLDLDLDIPSLGRATPLSSSLHACSIRTRHGMAVDHGFA